MKDKIPVNFKVNQNPYIEYNQNIIEKNEVISGDLPIELVLLTKNKSVYKVFNNNDYIFSYLEQGYELVAYEKKAGDENIYFYQVFFS